MASCALGLSHFAPFYRGLSEYARGACTFVREGLSSAEPVLVAVPGRRLNLVRGALGEAATAAGAVVSFANTAVLGRNPAGSSRPSAGSPIAAARAAPGSSASRYGLEGQR
jgi:MEDS: MEthanogen/methylotroph, DcmR Sensory domain